MKSKTAMFLTVVAMSASLWSGPSAAALTTCADSNDDAYMLLGSNGGASIECWDWGDQPNPGALDSEAGAGVGGDDILQLPHDFFELIAKSDGLNSSFFDILSGSLTGGFTGTFMLGQMSSDSVALLFKSGGGENSPSWWLFSVDNVTEGEVFTWNLFGTAPVNQLSHVEAYGVPEPGTLGLIGLGLIGIGFAGRRKPA
jgi:hypothetical protein